MKHISKILLALLLCSTALLTACDEGNQPVDSEHDTTAATEETAQPTEQETEAPTTEELTEITTEEETIVPNDGKPKKFFTLSFDDGITQDLKIIEILKKYDVKCVS